MRIERVDGTQGAATGAEAVQNRKLEAGAHAFEAMLLGEMLKPLKFGEAEASDDDGDGGAAGTMRGIGTEALSKAISDGGGLGIADEILHGIQVERGRHFGTGSATKV